MWIVASCHSRLYLACPRVTRVHKQTNMLFENSVGRYSQLQRRACHHRNLLTRRAIGAGTSRGAKRKQRRVDTAGARTNAAEEHLYAE